jgi:hypothetical protein
MGEREGNKAILNGIQGKKKKKKMGGASETVLDAKDREPWSRARIRGLRTSTLGQALSQRGTKTPPAQVHPTVRPFSDERGKASRVHLEKERIRPPPRRQG